MWGFNFCVARDKLQPLISSHFILVAQHTALFSTEGCGAAVKNRD